jgi:hypothetical protein
MSGVWFSSFHTNGLPSAPTLWRAGVFPVLCDRVEVIGIDYVGLNIAAASAYKGRQLCRFRPKPDIAQQLKNKWRASDAIHPTGFCEYVMRPAFWTQAFG